MSAVHRLLAHRLLLSMLLLLVGCGCQRGPRLRDSPRRLDGVTPVRSDGVTPVRPDDATPVQRVRPRPRAISGVAVTASWWMQRHAQKLARVKKGGVDLVMIGDSITHYWESEGKKVWDRYYGKRKAVNLGFSGDSTQNVLWRLRHGEVDGIAPKVAVVMIGTNDAGTDARPARTIATIRAIVNELRTRLPRTKILLLAIFPCGADEKDEQRRRNAAVSRIITKMADGRWVHFLNINQRFLTRKGILETRIMPDLLHPSAKGYRIWAQAMEPTLKRLMGER